VLIELPPFFLGKVDGLDEFGKKRDSSEVQKIPVEVGLLN